MNVEDNYQEITEILEKFKNGEELYRNSALFNKAVQMMAEGMNIYEVFEAILKVYEQTDKAFEDYILRDTRPLPFHRKFNH